MTEHGDYTLTLIKHVIHVYPRGGFNEDGINALHNEIRETAPVNKKWVLIEHPKDLAGLTPEAAEALSINYSKLADIGCVAVGLEVNEFWEKVIKSAIESKLTIPVYFNEDLEKLELKVLEHL